VHGFVRGAYAATIGTILGACFLLGRIAIGDWLTALIGLASLARSSAGKSAILFSSLRPP
jgi:chromate transporter